MSLLMQALKKAERAKLNSLPESELDKPSEAYDDLLSLSPAAPPSAAPSLGDLSLEPLDGPAGAASASASANSSANSSPNSTPNYGAAGTPARAEPSLHPLSLDDGLPSIPLLSVASEAIHDPVPPQARHTEAKVAPPRGAGANNAGAAAAAARSRANQHTERPAVPRGAARAKAAASAVHSDKLGLDPARLRLLVLSAIMALVLLVFAYIFWQAVYGPGAGSKLPMVPMPPPNATGATPALVVVAQPAGAGATDAGTAEQLGHMADIQHYNMQEAQRREEQRQFELSRASARLPAPPPAPETVAPAAPPADAGIQVRHTRPAPQLDPALQAGYAAVNNGDWPAAQQQYDSVLARDANNRDALLGSAAVAERQKRPDQATAAYLRLLELDPGDADAMAGLIGLNQGDQEQSEQRLQNLLKQHPESGPLHFALGNLYARQGRWPDAQQSYFRAYSAAPGDADYAYNLAVGLDRLNQPKLALTYYQRALALAQDRAANFDRNALRKRMHDLAPAAAR